jgi:selenide,water dikinase
MWKMHALPDTDLTCISDNTIATYSGMLPAVLAGQIPPERMEIDLVRLCGVSGARLLTNSVTGINHQKREINFVDRPRFPLTYFPSASAQRHRLKG